MKIVITAAGKSQRFKDRGYLEPKFRLEILELSVLEHIINMFEATDDVLVVTTLSLFEKNEEYFLYLKEMNKRIDISIIDEHNDGPVSTVLTASVQNWLGSDPFIVSYCDFFVRWNYQAFMRQIDEDSPDGCIVTFSGMQSASRGKTLFAYLNTRGKDVLEIREKKSFTNSPISELTSAGIYFFKNAKIFRRFSQESIGTFEGYSEKYVSLVYNPMIKANLRVTHFQCDKFIGLGTPEDFEEFKYWENYFHSRNSLSSLGEVENKLIPMAGGGARFKKAQIDVPKALIPINQEPMFFQALNSAPRATNNILLTSKDITKRVASASANISKEQEKVLVVNIPGKTSGPGATILEAKPLVGEMSDVVVSSCDYYLSINHDEFSAIRSQEGIDVIIFYCYFNYYRMRNPRAFAYCKTNQVGLVEKVVEKSLLSDSPENDKLIVGTFWFRRGSDLISALEQAETENCRVNGEIYVGNSINYLIEKGLKVGVVQIKHWISFGDPEELEVFFWWQELLGDKLQTFSTTD